MQLTASRLILREFIDQDWRRIAEYRSDPRHLAYYPENTSTEARARSFVQMVIGWGSEMPRQKFQMAIVRASDGLLLGNCGVRITSAEHREAEFGCELDAREWNQGYAAEAGRAIIDFGFRELGMHRIWSHTISQNLAALNLAERLGMRKEGCLRENQFFKGCWWDTLVFSMLENEWRGA